MTNQPTKIMHQVSDYERAYLARREAIRAEVEAAALAGRITRSLAKVRL